MDDVVIGDLLIREAARQLAERHEVLAEAALILAQAHLDRALELGDVVEIPPR